jgi:CubicO group peptidase (beta-lactamase class C family)
MCVVFSGTKGLVATCVLRLIDAGLIELDAPVSRYWPEFAAGGKEDVLVRHVMCHQAGLPGVRAPLGVDDVTDPRHMAALLAGQQLFWPAGSRLWYHPITYGWLCGELVRRVTGETLGAYLRREIAEPLGLELWIGLPAALEDRVAVLTRADTWRGVAADGPAGDVSEEDIRDVWRNPDHFPSELPWNTRAWRACEMPGANGIATARAMASFYGVLACSGSRGETTILSPQAIELGRTQLSEGIDPILGEQLRFGVGWALQPDDHRFGPPADAFGHGGAGGSEHGAWPRERVGFSYVMNLMRDDDEDDRASGLLDALDRCVHGVGRR